MEKEKIIETITNLFAGTDERNWARVENALASTVLLDYTSMTGGEPSLLTPKQITAAWSAFLPGFDSTHHKLSGFQIKIDGGIANAKYNGIAEHFIEKDVWIVEGNYETELTLQNGNWLITKHTFNFINQYGNTSLPAKATEIMKNKTL